MKKTAILSVLVLLIFALASCKNNKPADSVQETATPQIPTEAPEPTPTKHTYQVVTPTPTPTPEPTAKKAVTVNASATIFAGTYYSMAIKADGSLWAWGENSTGQLGDGTTTDRKNPVKIMDDVMFASGGYVHTMAVKSDGSLWGWGENDYGQLGDGTTSSSLSPKKIMDDVIFVSARKTHTMAIKTDGSLWGWGDNKYGKLGNGTKETCYTPVKILDDVKFVSAGHTNTMVIRADDSLWGWGYFHFKNEPEDMSEYDPEDDTEEEIESEEDIIITLAPEKITDGVYLVMSGKNRTIYMKFGGELWYLYEKESPLLEGVKTFCAGILNTTVIRKDGTLWNWGLNDVGQLGDGTTENRNTLKQIFDDVIAACANGAKHTLVLKPDGSLWAWGLNDHGQLGDGTLEDKHVPTKIMTGVKLPK